MAFLVILKQGLHLGFMALACLPFVCTLYRLRHMKTTLLLIALAFSIQAQTIDNKPPFDEWEFLTQGYKPDASVANIHFAPKTIARNDDLVKVWVRATNHWGRYFRDAWSGSVETMPDIKTVELDVHLDCKHRTAKADDVMVYNSSGSLIHRGREKEKVKGNSNTVLWMTFEYFCEKEGKKLTGPPTLK